MKITVKFLSIPPYVSTAWKNISSLQVREEAHTLILMIFMKDGSKVEIPGLNKSAIAAIFEAHVQSLTQEDAQPSEKNILPDSFGFSIPLMKNDTALFETFGASLQHNPDQTDMPPLSESILQKITTLARAFGLEHFDALPESEPNCHCLYCQIMNALRHTTSAHHEEHAKEEEVKPEDLKFREWDVNQTAEKLYTVTNPIDTNEHYSVFLGQPLGCTCGHKDCEHIRAVLNT